MPSPIRIAFFADILVRDFDGAARTMYHIIDRKPADVDIMYYCGVPPEEDGYDVVSTRTITAPGNATYQISMPWRDKTRLHAALQRFAPDIIHIASPSLLGNFAVDYGQQHGIPVNTIYHTHFVSYIAYYLRSVPFMVQPIVSLVKYLYRRFYNRCQRVLVPTEEMRGELTTIGVKEEKMYIWERGIDTKIFNQEKKNHQYIRSITQNEHPTILFASRLVWEKNVETLIRLCKLLEDHDHKYNLIVAGDGVARRVMADRMPTAHFLGEVSQDDLAHLYSSADVFVFTSISETFGNVVTEAMACGCPCVIADGGGTTAHIRDGISGYLVTPEDPASYLQRIDQLVHDKTLRQSIIDAGLQYTSSLSWDRLADRFFSNIAEVIDEYKATR